MSTNPYEAALSQELDVYGSSDPLNKSRCGDLKLSILSNVLSYKVADKRGSFATLNKSLLYNTISEDNLDYPPVEDKEFIDKFEEVTAYLSTSSLFNECTEVSTTYLGLFTPGDKVRKFLKQNEISLSHNCTTEGALISGTTMKILFDTGATRSYMSKLFYMKHPELHTLPKFASNCKGIMVGNGQCVPVMFVIPIIVMIQGHIFEIFTTICDIHEGIDLVFGMQNMIETEGEMSARNGCY